MAKLSNREKILAEGMKLVHSQGFAGASVRDIVAAAGVPQGSFTNHFASKEAFGLEILNLYFVRSAAMIDVTLRNDDWPPLARLHAYFDANIRHIGQDEMRNGCMLGNFSAEITEVSEAIRLRLVEIFAQVQGAIAYCLRAAVAAGELPADMECEAAASMILSGLQGATLVAKALRSAAPIEDFERMVFAKVLR
jgi:TetR/AcrR family transcriptional repressor of nem operon